LENACEMLFHSKQNMSAYWTLQEHYTKSTSTPYCDYYKRK